MMTVNRLFTEFGGQVGPPADSECRRCSHAWGPHELHLVNDETRSGMWSCPEEDCTCAGTWSLGLQTTKTCAWGRTLTHPDATPCDAHGGNCLLLKDTGQEIYLCDWHFATVTEKLDAQRNG